MKKKKWTMTPWFIIFAAAMFFMSFASYKYDLVLFYIEISASVLAFAIVFAMSLSFSRYVRGTVKNATERIGDVNTEYLEKYKYPITVVGIKGDIVWCNSHFRKSVCNGRSPEGESISAYLAGNKLDKVLAEDSSEILINGKEYTVYSMVAGKSIIFQYFDNTYYKQLAREYYASKPCVAIAVFDNAEDFADNSDKTYLEITLKVETFLQRWATAYDALYKKIGNNRYLFIFKETDVDRMIYGKFSVLSDVRTITANRISATISVGLCRGADNVKISEANARKALEMALGRGGDQVAVIKKDNTFEFFGGKSTGHEISNKVRMRVIANAINRTVLDCDKVYIMGHKFSDLDSVGAAVGLQCIMEKTYKKYSKVVINRGTSMAKPLITYICDKSESDIFISPDDAIRGVTSKTLLIIVDTHIKKSLESLELYEKCKKVIVIDHHRKAVDYINNALVFCHEPTASSASEMCSEIIEYLDDSTIDYVQADALLAGIMLDTKNFAIKTSSRTFEASAYLRRKGANTVTVRSMLSDNIETYKEKVGIVCSSRIYRGCAVAIAKSEFTDIRMASAQAADEMLSLNGVKASFVIFDDSNTEGQVNISARSYGKINVQIIMEKLGGGGHHTMAATQLKNTTKEHAYRQLMAIIDTMIDDISNT